MLFRCCGKLPCSSSSSSFFFLSFFLHSSSKILSLSWKISEKMSCFSCFFKSSIKPIDPIPNPDPIPGKLPKSSAISTHYIIVPKFYFLLFSMLKFGHRLTQIMKQSRMEMGMKNWKLKSLHSGNFLRLQITLGQRIC